MLLLRRKRGNMTKYSKGTYDLNSFEIKILKEISEGKTNGEIAKNNFVSIHTIKFYVSSILYKLSVNTRIEAAVKAVKENILN